MKYAFKKMFQIAIEFPVEAWPRFEEYELWNIVEFRADPVMAAKVLIQHEFFDFNQWEHVVYYLDLYEPWFVNSVFGKSNSKIDRKAWI